jgi:hypothetical protein
MTRIDGVVRQFARERKTMTTNFEETLISVWRQALVEDRKTVTLEGVHYPVRPTSRSKLREVDFRFEEQTLRGLEQNPNTNSRWAQLAREGKKVMQFLSDGRYITSRRCLMQRNGRRKFVYNPDPRSAPLDVEAEPDGKE